jgi:hypothetical protein
VSVLRRLWPFVAATSTFGVVALVARGSITIDTGLGRRLRPLGPIDVDMDAPRDVVFDVIASPYLGRTPRALGHELQVWERSTDMVLAAHFTKTRWFTTTTVETVHFARPERVSFRLARGPVPHVVETFELSATDRGTRLRYAGELGADFWQLGSAWSGIVARTWERTVRESLESIREESERRATTQLRRRADI